MENSFLQALVMAGASTCYIGTLLIIFKMAAYFKVNKCLFKEKLLAIVAALFLAVVCSVVFERTLLFEKKFAVIFLVVGILAGILIGYLQYRENIKKRPQTRQQRRHAK